jgi:hypothetical protein
VSEPVTRGKPARLMVPLRNDGNIPATRTPATYTLTLTPQFDTTAGTQVFSTTVTGRINLKPGAAKPQRLRLTLPAGSTVVAGPYTLTVQLSAELNQTNGTAVASIPVTVV